MDQLLCQSNEDNNCCIDITITLSDDEDLLPISFYHAKQDLKQVDQNESLINSESVAHNLTAIKHKESHIKSEDQNKCISVDCEKSTKSTTYYTECPVCDSFGPKSINHIKLCANKHSINPKDVLKLLKDCKKTNPNVRVENRNISKTNGKRRKKLNNNLNNYVISFEPEKGLKLTIDPNLVNNKCVKKSANYELTHLDLDERKVLLETKISEQILSNIVDNYAQQTDIDKIVVPNIWKVSVLQSQSDEYIAQDFEKYSS